MLPLAMIMKARGADVRGSDRSRDQGRTPERFAFIEKQGIHLSPQDGSGVTAEVGRVVVSAAVEETVPDVQAARALGIPVVRRAELLAELFNASRTAIAVAGTSGKSTVTGMLGWILHRAGLRPTVMNGAVMRNFVTPDVPFASALVGDPDLFVSEVDESDGSISFFTPRVAVLNNIAFDHKTMDELRGLFGDFVRKAEIAVLNIDNAEVAVLAEALPAASCLTYSLRDPAATLFARNLVFHPGGATFDLVYRAAEGEQGASIELKVPGHHNVSNALAAIGGALAVGIGLTDAAESLGGFLGIARRLEVVGTTLHGVTVIDDFAHNPDKIAASLRTLHQTPGRLMILFQPHGYGPLRLMRAELAACFAQGLAAEDGLFLSDPLYLGGTTDKSVGSGDLAQDIVSLGRRATHISDRSACAEALAGQVRPGDTVVVMGARDDTLPALARGLLERFSNEK